MKAGKTGIRAPGQITKIGLQQLRRRSIRCSTGGYRSSPEKNELRSCHSLNDARLFSVRGWPADQPLGMMSPGGFASSPGSDPEIALNDHDPSSSHIKRERQLYRYADACRMAFVMSIAIHRSTVTDIEAWIHNARPAIAG